MPRYTYIAKTQPYKTIEGELEAETEQEAVNKLTNMGYFPVSVRLEDLSFDKQGIFRLPKVYNKDIVMFTRQLSGLLDSGVNIINSLNIISRQAGNKYLKSVLVGIIGKIRDGRPLSDSLTDYPRLFSGLYSAMIRTGEASGNLNEVLKRLADFLEKEEEFKNSVWAALTYPIFVFIVGVLTVLALLVFVIPRLVTMFEDMGQVLPLPTRILIGVSDFFRAYGIVVIVSVFVFIFILRRLYQSPQGRLSLDRFKLKAALIGQIILKTEISRMMRTLSLLLSSGVPITPSLEISASVIGNQVLKSEIQKFKDKIASGASLSSSFKDSKLFPELVNNIISIGEETGSVDKSLSRIADEYERDVDRALKILTQLLEPVIILTMGLIVGFIVLSMLLPIFQINLIVR